jgi:phosphatidylglycerophosphate synthase
MYDPSGMGTDLQAGKSERRYRLAALFQAYAAEKASEEWHGEWGAALLYRPLAILVSPPLLRLGVPACAITILSLLAALSLPVVALTAGLIPLALAAILVGILDCLDGTIARASGTISRRGQYLDFITDIVFRTTLYVSVGLLAQGAAPSGLRALALPLAILAVLLAIAARLCRIYAEHLAGAKPYSRQTFSGGAGQWVFSALSGLDPLLPLAILALGLAGWMGWLIPWLLFYSALDFLYTQFAILRSIA